VAVGSVRPARLALTWTTVVPMHEPASARRWSSLVAACEKHVVLAIGVLAVCAYVAIYAVPLMANPVRSDGFSYYVYLPAWVIHADPTLEDLSNRRFGGSYPAWSGLTRWPGTERWVNPHQMGVAVLLLPLYLGGHALTLLRHYPVEGFSFFYRHAAGLGGALYLAAGLFFLRRLLERHVPAGVALATLLTITFGTNLFHYATFDSLWSHVYSFSLVACLLDLLDRWERQPTRARAGVLGIVIGLIALVRMSNAAVLLFLLLFGVAGPASLGARLSVLRGRAPHLALMAAMAVLVVSPQLAFYKSATGSLVVDPYGNLLAGLGVAGFDFLHPKLAGVLVGTQKGLFFWSPALLLGVIGCFALQGPLRAFLLPSLAVFAVNTLLVASWWDWQFGGSYGHRGFTDLLAIFALPIAALYERAARHPLSRALVAVCASLAVALSVAQMIQYWVGIVPISDVTWDQYRAFFLRFSR
jgi:hypothetical protein